MSQPEAEPTPAGRSPLHISRAWPLYLGILVAGSAAVFASVTTLAYLADKAEWPGNSMWLLPACVDVTGAVGAWAWLRPGTSERATRFGRWVTFACIGLSLAGNAAGHLIAAEFLDPGPVLILTVGAVPPTALAALVHLWVLVLDRSPEAPTSASEATPDARPGGMEKPLPDGHTDGSATPVPEPSGTTSPVPSQPVPAPRPTARPRRAIKPSGRRSRDDLRLEMDEAIRMGKISALTAAEIQRVLKCKAETARELRAEEVARRAGTREPSDDQEEAR